MSDRSSIERWVARINALAREMDERAASLHPTAWPEAMKLENEKFRKIAKQFPEFPR